MISCNSHARGTRDGQNGSFMQMKMDTKTFGNFQQRPYLGYDWHQVSVQDHVVLYDGWAH